MTEELIEKQKELMEEVPHGVNPRVLMKMAQARVIMEKLLLYLSSCGHKPWRPTPLPEEHIEGRYALFLSAVDRLSGMHRGALHVGPLVTTEESRRLVSALGVIEETLEYLEVTEQPPDRQKQLEEITDVLFFYLELVVLGEFSWAEIEKEYVRKHAVNLDRYRRAKKGNYSWNHRDKGGL